MSLDTAYNLLPLPVGDWVFWLPFPLISLLLLALAVLVLIAVAVRLHRRQAHVRIRNLALACIPLWGGFLFFWNAREWLYWTLGWFYATALVTLAVAFVNRKALPYMLAILLGALLQHQGSVIMVRVLART